MTQAGPALPTDQEVERWERDGLSWVVENVWVPDPMTGRVGPIRLQPHQEEFLREAFACDANGIPKYKICIPCWAKRQGKTTMPACVGTRHLCLFIRQNDVVLANSQEQAESAIFRQIAGRVERRGNVVGGMFQDSPRLRVYRPQVERTKIEVPATKSVLRCYTTNWGTHQGELIDLLLTDELHASDDPSVFTVASLQTDSPRAQIIVSSQAGAPVDSNPLWRMYNARSASVFFDYRQEVTTPWGLRQMQQALDSGRMTPAEVAYYFRNEWGHTGLKLFSPADVGRAALPYREPRTRAEWEALVKEWRLGQPVAIGAGLDRAGVSASGDRSVWTVAARFAHTEATRKPHEDHTDPAGDVFRVVRCAVLPTGSEGEVLAEHRQSLAVFGRLDAVRLEAYQCADLTGKIEGATLEHASAPRQQGLFGRLHHLLREGRLGFPEDAGEWRDPKGFGHVGLLKAELLNFEHEVEKGNVRFGTQSGHDDTVYSAAWSVEAAASQDTYRPQRPVVSGPGRILQVG